jgi:hypothetical protein
MGYADEKPSEAVVSEIADREDVSVRDLRPLYEVVSPESLDTLFRNGTGYVAFEYEGYVVTVDDGCEVEASKIDDRPNPPD